MLEIRRTEVREEGVVVGVLSLFGTGRGTDCSDVREGGVEVHSFLEKLRDGLFGLYRRKGVGLNSLGSCFYFWTAVGPANSNVSTYASKVEVTPNLLRCIW